MATAPRAAITGFGSAVPEKVLTNADFETFLDTSDEWITSRTGIKERHVCAEGESTATLATEAARKALADAGVGPTDIDLIICCTVTPDMLFPATASFIQEALGATDVPCFDLSAACSGFIYGLTVACQFIETGMYKRVLVIGADSITHFADYTDRRTCILFGDAAGAVVLERTKDEGKGILYNVLHADGKGWEFIHLPAGGSRNPATHGTVDAKEHYIHMNGRDVYRFAVAKMQWLLGDCMEKCGLTVDDVDLVVPHQVNIRIIKSAAKKFDFPMEKLYLNIERYGNTSAASIPLALAEAWQTGRIGPGSMLLVIAFGAGLTWAGSVIQL